MYNLMHEDYVYIDDLRINVVDSNASNCRVRIIWDRGDVMRLFGVSYCSYVPFIIVLFVRLCLIANHFGRNIVTCSCNRIMLCV